LEGLRLNSVPMSFLKPQRTFVNFVPERRGLDLREVPSIGKRGGASGEFNSLQSSLSKHCFWITYTYAPFACPFSHFLFA